MKELDADMLKRLVEEEVGPLKGTNYTCKRADYVKQKFLDLGLSVSTQKLPHEDYNVIAKKENGAEKTLIFSSHHDRRWPSFGADDNASGDAAVIGVAKILVYEDLPYDLCFVSFGAEECGLEGSKLYVSRLGKSELENILLVCNFDLVGRGKELVLAKNGSYMNPIVSLVRGTKKVLFHNANSDHSSFSHRGVPTVWISRTSNGPTWPWRHTRADTPKYIDGKKIKECVEYALDLVSRI